MVVAFSVRAAVVLWAGGKFAPAADGVYYHTIASRIALGLGSTWLWPDGTVTYAAHYPIGYPALLSVAYRIFGATPSAAAWTNALLGVLCCVAVHRLALASAPPKWAFFAALAVAVHPALVMYTPAVMTEGVTASLLVIAAWCASARSRPGLALLGLVMGIATLVRPQSLLLAPCFGFLSSAPQTPAWHRLRRAAIATALALLVCAPWTLRNCMRMHRCALVSVNGGWNLLIGASERATGRWAPVEVPEACRTVWGEAEKDACFEREARRLIARAPARWLSLVPARLAATFDYSGAPGYYLHASNPAAFGERAEIALGGLETLYERVFYLGALACAAFLQGPRRRLRGAIVLVSAALLFQVHGYLAVLGLVLALGLHGRALFDRATLVPATLFVLAATALVHAAFFGAGRYAMVVFPFVTAVGCIALTASKEGRDTRV